MMRSGERRMNKCINSLKGNHGVKCTLCGSSSRCYEKMIKLRTRFKPLLFLTSYH